MQSNNKFFKGRGLLLAAVVLIAVGAFYMWRDLHLSALRNMNLPDIVVENIEIERIVNGKNWKIVSPRAEHRDGVIYGSSVDITISDPNNGRNTHIYADKSTFTRKNNDVMLQNGDGTMEENGKKYSMKSGLVEYKAKTEEWIFSNGLVLSSDKMVVEGAKGTYAAISGDCYITNGGTITWRD